MSTFNKQGQKLSETLLYACLVLLFVAIPIDTVRDAISLRCPFIKDKSKVRGDF